MGFPRVGSSPVPARRLAKPIGFPRVLAAGVGVGAGG